MSRLLELTIAAKLNSILGYPGSSEIALAVERGEVICQGLTISTFFSREPFLTWKKKDFVRMLAQSGLKRETRVPDAPTIYELMDQYKTPATTRRVAQSMLLGGGWARPMMVTPGTPADRVKILREAYEKASKDPDLLAEAKKLRIDVEPSKGEELQGLAKDVLEQPAEVIEQVKKLFVQ
jgi:tripartite-type tricarboxylate transporter receptor subunit TctC